MRRYVKLFRNMSLSVVLLLTFVVLGAFLGTGVSSSRLLIDSIVIDSVRVSQLVYDYSNGDSLYLNYYAPIGPEDLETPLLIYVHGGGFAGGSPNADAYREFGMYMAHEGIAVANISYRLTAKGKGFSCKRPASEKIQTFQGAVNDIRRATQALLNQQDRYHFCDQMVILAGSSAGAEAVLHAAFAPPAADAPSLPEGFRYAGIISMAGAVVDTNLITSENAVPILLFHGEADKVVPFGHASHHFCDSTAVGYLPLFGSRTITERYWNLEAPYVVLSQPGGGHEWNERPMQEYRPLMVDFVQNDVRFGIFRQWDIVTLP